MLVNKIQSFNVCYFTMHSLMLRNIIYYFNRATKAFGDLWHDTGRAALNELQSATERTVTPLITSITSSSPHWVRKATTSPPLPHQTLAHKGQGCDPPLQGLISTG